MPHTIRPASASLTRFVSLVLCYGLVLSQLTLLMPTRSVALDRQGKSQKATPETAMRSRTPAHSPTRVFGFGGLNSALKSGSSNTVGSQPLQSQQSSSTVVISQIYGGGGNSGSTYKNDFIELFNRSNTIVDLTNWSVQYASASSATWQVAPLSGSIGPGQYLLIQAAQGAAGTTDLPTPDITSALAMSASSGKVALVNNVAALSSTFPLGNPSIVDFVGYGSSASCYEGVGATPSASNINAVLRANNGCTDTDSNSIDFNAALPIPRNSSAEARTCGGAPLATVVISEFRTRGDNGGFDEFIELYNKTDNPINISGWKIKASNSEGGIGTRLVINPGTIIPARGHFLATNDNASGGYNGLPDGHYLATGDNALVVGDQTYSMGIPDNGGIAIVTPDDTVMDRVGMSDNSAFKESRALSPLSGDYDLSFERKPGWGNGSEQDTDDNPTDFQSRLPSDPQNLHSPPSSSTNQPPIADAGGPYHFLTGTPVYGNGYNSRDNDGAIVSYAWDFGDGTGSRTLQEHIYTAPGTYTVTLTVTDNAGAQASASATATVIQAPPPTPTPTPTATPTPSPTPTPTPDVKVHPNSRLEPRNRVGSAGEDLLSGNFNWSVPLIGLEGRADLDLGLALAYNSLTWTTDLDGQRIVFDEDQGYPAAGFRLGLPVIQGYYGGDIASTPPQHSYTLVMPTGQRIGLWQTSSPYKYESADSSALLLDRVYGDPNILYLKKTNGTRYKFVLHGESYKCVEVKDSNGNYISASYDAQGRILTITDTLARVFTFNYEGGNLVSITQPWGGQPHVWAKFEYEPLLIQTNFVKSDGTPLQAVGNGQTINALKRVILADQSSYRFTYNVWGQAYQIARYAADDHLLSSSSYNLPVNSNAPLADCPRFTERHDWAQFWNGDQDGVPAANEVARTRYTIALDGEMGSVTLPDNATTHKEYFATTTWQKGLTTKAETYYAGALKRWVTNTWTQDDESLSHQVNPRQVETNIYDSEGNRRRTVTKYLTRTSSPRISLPTEIILYNGNGPNLLKHTLNFYDGFGRISHQENHSWINKPVYIANVLFIADGYLKLASKTTYEYDLGGSYLVSQGAPSQHDNSYATSLTTGRGNLCVVRRWDADNPTDISKSSKSETGYNITGSVIFRRDALGSATRQTTISYTDSNGGNTLAYPTTITDPDGFSTTIQYNYDLGLSTRNRNPKGAEQVMTYDPVTGRIQKQTLHDGTTNQDVTYMRFVYAPSQTEVASYTLIDNGVESYASNRLDGAGNVIGVASNHPGSAGGYSGQKFVYDVLGRQTGQTNPAEINNPAGVAVASWTPTGDDAGGWHWNSQQYDWKGRPTVSTNTDGTVTEASYNGCGCAGGETITLKGEQLAEGRRTQKIYNDILGREYKREILDWSGNIYTTTVNSYNERDQITLARQYAGAEGSASYQDTTYTYDGYGRVRQRNNPAQTGGTGTTYTYDANDSVESMTDARGAKTFYEYNKRGLLTKMSYYAPPPAQWQTQIKIPGPTTFSYDSAGNRTEMTDEYGSMTYEFDGLSRLKSETRHFNEPVPQAPSGNQLKLQYTYTQSGQLKSITDSFGEYVGYHHDSAGRLASVGGILPGGEQIQYATNGQYRAWGALKGLDYPTGLQMRMSFNSRLQAEEYSLLGRKTYNSNGQTDALSINYQYYADGRLRFSEESHSQTNPGAAFFARSYEYDFMGRLTLAKSGAEARGQVETDLNKRPYRQSFTYDLFEGMIKADRWHWTQNYVTIPEGGISGTYDAGGRLISDASAGSPNATTFWRDGQGQILKSRAVGTDCDQNLKCERTTYYVNSSVLGAKVVNELIQTYYPATTVAPGIESPAKTDQKLETYIFAGSARIAKHEIVLNNPLRAYLNHDTTYIENRDASGVFFDEMIIRGTGPVYSSVSAATRPNYYLQSDPFGADVGLKNPYIPPPPDDYGPPPCAGPEPDDCGYEEEEEEFSYSGSDYEEEGYGNPVEFTCYVDGFEQRCEDVFNLIEAAGEGSSNVTREREFAAPSSAGPQAIWEDAYNTISLGDVANEIDPNGSPYQVIAQVNIGIEDEGYFVMGGAMWDTKQRTRQPRNPLQKLASKTKLSDEDCDQKLKEIFAKKDGPAVAYAMVNKDMRAPNGRGPNGHSAAPRNDFPKTIRDYDNGGMKPNPDRGGIIHIYTDSTGTGRKDVGLYAPAGWNGQPVAYYVGGNSGLRFNYGSVTISFVHPGTTNKDNVPSRPSPYSKDKNEMGSIRIGYVGGKGGEGAGYTHTHIIFYSNFAANERVDPRVLFCGFPR